jgi:hypothetical protein
MSDTRTKGPSPATTLTGYDPSTRATRRTGEIPIPPLNTSMTSEELRRTVDADAVVEGSGAMPIARTLELELRYAPPPPLPRNPLPLDEPCAHPALFGGRETELASWWRLLRLPVPVLGLHGGAGVGKTSLLQAGLIPALRAAGHPVAFLSLPATGSVAARLIGGLLVQRPLGETERGQPEDPTTMAARRFDDPGAFVDLLCAARRLSGKSVVLVVDPLDDALGDDATGQALAVLLRTSVEEEMQSRPFHWLFCFRRTPYGAGSATSRRPVSSISRSSPPWARRRTAAIGARKPPRPSRRRSRRPS